MKRRLARLLTQELPRRPSERSTTTRTRSPKKEPLSNNVFSTQSFLRVTFNTPSDLSMSDHRFIRYAHGWITILDREGLEGADVQQRGVNVHSKQAAVEFDETESAEFVQKEADSGASRPDHFW